VPLAFRRVGDVMSSFVLFDTTALSVYRGDCEPRFWTVAVSFRTLFYSLLCRCCLGDIVSIREILPHIAMRLVGRSMGGSALSLDSIAHQLQQPPTQPTTTSPHTAKTPHPRRSNHNTRVLQPCVIITSIAPTYSTPERKKTKEKNATVHGE
jgi:hypothetical protein